MGLRKTMNKLHLWLSLLAGLFICLLSLSGSALVFENEINRMLHTDLYKATPGPAVSYDQAYQTVLHTYPKAQIQRIYSPDEFSSKGIYTFLITNQKKSLSVYVDPGTGKILGTQTGDTFTNWLSEFHHYFFLKEYNGMKLVGVVGLIFFVILLTGLFLWWPGLKNWIRGFTFRRTSNRYVQNLDFHRIFGMAWVPFLLVVSLTGALFPFGKDFLQVFDLKTSTSPSKDKLVAEPLPSGYVPLDQLILAAQTQIADGKVTQIRMPKKAAPGEKEGVVEIRMSHQYDPSNASTGNARVWVDPYSAKVVATTDAAADSSFASVYQTWLFPLHTGRFGGLFTQILFAIGGIVPTMLMVTGLVMMRLKAVKKKQAALKRPRGQVQLENLPQAQ